MKKLFGHVLPILLVGLALSAVGLGAGITVDVRVPHQSGPAGMTFDFGGTITNHTDHVIDARDWAWSFSEYHPFHAFPVDLTFFLASFPPGVTLAPGETSRPVTFFSLVLDSRLPSSEPIPPGRRYWLTASLETLDGDVSDPVRVSATLVPEPATWILLAAALPMLAVLRRRKLALVLSLPLLVGIVHAQPAVVVETRNPAMSWRGQELLVALPVVNAGTDTGDRVQVRRIDLSGRNLVSPVVLPVLVEPLAPGIQRVIQMAFNGDLQEGVRYRLRIDGTYSLGGRTYGFQANRVLLLPPTRGLAVATSGSGQGETTDGTANPGPTSYVYQGPTNPGILPPVPVNPFAAAPVALGPPTSAGAAPSVGALANQAVALAGEPQVVFRSTERLGAAAKDFKHPQEPSGAAAWYYPRSGAPKRVILQTGNTFGAMSITEGDRPDFKNLDLAKIFKPTDAAGNLIDGGLCCDQVVLYLPSRDLFVWIMQFGSARDAQGRKLNNRLRVAFASPRQIVENNGLKWTFFNITPSGGLSIPGANDWLDYPTLGYTRGNLFIGISQFQSTLVPDKAGTKVVELFQKRHVIRIPLAQLTEGATSYSWNSVSYDLAGNSALTAGDVDSVYWAGIERNDAFRIWEWKDADSFADSSVVTVATTDRDSSKLTSMAPDGYDMFTKPPGISGAVQFNYTHLDGSTERTVTFAWTGGRDSAHLQPFARITSFRREFISVFPLYLPPVFTKTGELDLYSNDYAWGYPALALHPIGQMGIAAGVGGGTLYPRAVMGFLDGGKLSWIDASDRSDWVASGARFGDYFTVQSDIAQSGMTDDICFNAFTYGVFAEPAATNSGGCSLTGTGLGCRFENRYTRFCRPAVQTPK